MPVHDTMLGSKNWKTKKEETPVNKEKETHVKVSSPSTLGALNC